MSDNDIAANQQELLATYRRMLQHLLDQAAQYGGEPFAPPDTGDRLSQAREQIRSLKEFLRQHGAVVEDQPGEEPPVARLPAAPVTPPSHDQIAGDKIAGDKIVAPGAQGLIMHSTGPINQTNIINYYQPGAAAPGGQGQLIMQGPDVRQQRLLIAVIAATGFITVLTALAGTLSTNTRGAAPTPYLWLVWPVTIIFGGVSAGLGVWQYRSSQQGPNMTPDQAQRNRRLMLDRVKAIWIDGLLQSSLAGVARIDIELVDQDGLVDQPFGAQVQEINRPPRALPPGVALIDVFAAMNGAMLILGMPGAGKTTLLLELARDLIARAERDAAHPIPVVFNISSWGSQEQHTTPPDLAQWLIDELQARYDVPQFIARAWVESDALLLLLDGLDEAPGVERRRACVAALNTYRQQHGLVSLAICSRIAEYEELGVRLRLQGAVVIQPLTAEQVNMYLAYFGERLAPLQAAQASDPTLHELATSPLMLSIMARVYHDRSVPATASAGTAGTQSSWLFAAYIEKMFARRAASAAYPREQTLRWLAWLAHGMQNQSQRVFLIEQLQPSWLETRILNVRYALIDRLGGGLITGLAVGLIAGLSYGVGTGAQVGASGGFAAGWLQGLAAGMANGARFGLVAGLITGLLGRVGATTTAVDQSFWPFVRRAAHGVIVFGAIGALFGGVWLPLLIGIIRFRPLFSIQGLLADALFFGLVGGLGAGLLGGPSLRPRAINVVETRRWSWSRGLGLGMASGLIVAFISSLVYEESISQRGEWLVFGLVYGLSIWVIFGLAVGEVETRTAPNQGIWRSLRSARRVGRTAGLVSGLGGSLGGLIIGQPWFGISYGLSSAALVGLGGALVCGGYACLSHLALRIVLWHSGVAPWNLAGFLDYCAARILIRKAGGGYLFIHRLLQDYFVGLDNSDSAHEGLQK
jgi:hypothetical protein